VSKFDLSQVTLHEDSLLDMMVNYLESKGWYFDWDHINDVWGQTDEEKAYYKEMGEGDSLPLNERPDAIRQLHGWTLTQWDEYWQKPYSDDPTHKNFGAPKERRYEDLKQAVWSQMLREEEPKQFGFFFGDNDG